MWKRQFFNRLNMLVNAVLCEFGLKKWAKPNLEVFLEKIFSFYD